MGNVGQPYLLVALPVLFPLLEFKLRKIAIVFPPPKVHHARFDLWLVCAWAMGITEMSVCT